MNHSVKDYLENHPFLTFLYSEEHSFATLKLLWNRKVLQMLNIYCRREGSSMASWSTFIFKSVRKLRRAPNTPGGPLALKYVLILKHLAWMNDQETWMIVYLNGVQCPTLNLGSPLAAVHRVELQPWLNTPEPANLGLLDYWQFPGRFIWAGRIEHRCNIHAVSHWIQQKWYQFIKYQA